MNEPEPLYGISDAEKLKRNTAEMRRLRAYRTLVLTVATITVTLYIAGAVYALVTI